MGPRIRNLVLSIQIQALGFKLIFKFEPLTLNLNDLAISVAGFRHTHKSYFLESLQICDAVTRMVDPISPEIMKQW